jgi:hypothetical protein
MLDPALNPADHTLSDYLGGDGTDNNDERQKQDEALPWILLGSDIPRKIVNQFVECVKECGKE